MLLQKLHVPVRPVISSTYDLVLGYMREPYVA